MFQLSEIQPEPLTADAEYVPHVLYVSGGVLVRVVIEDGLQGNPA